MDDRGSRMEDRGWMIEHRRGFSDQRLRNPPSSILHPPSSILPSVADFGKVIPIVGHQIYLELPIPDNGSLTLAA